MAIHRVTVVDDSPEIRAVLTDALARDGVEVTSLGGESSVEDIVASQPDLLVVDLRLGTDHLPGWEIIRHARFDARFRDLPVIVCSGALDQLRTYGGAAVGARTYLLPKPFSLDDLEAVLAEASAKHGEHPERTDDAVDLEHRFSRDPYNWLAWVARQMREPGWSELRATLKPELWTNPAGRPWRVIRTPRGVEVRPDLVSPFLRYGNQPMVTALGFGDAVEVELTTQTERWVDRFGPETFDVAALGRAMLDEQKLPHDNLAQLFPPPSDAATERVMRHFRVGADLPEALRS